MGHQIVGRDVLYELVWSEPISRLAERYGYSDVGFAKLCRRAGIPLPSRGHWARIKAGKKTRRTPLPPSKPGQLQQVRLAPLSQEEIEAWRAKRDQEAEVRGSISPDRIATERTKLHPMATAARDRLRRQLDSSDQKRLRAVPKEVLDIEVTKGCIDRATLIASVIIRELEVGAGAIVRIDAEKGRTVLELRDTNIGLKISEHVARSPHEVTARENRALERYRASRWTGEYPHIPQYDFSPTGLLTVTATGWPVRKWRDTQRTPLENRLGEVIAGIISLAEEVRDREIESARRHLEHARKQERYEAELERRTQERFAYEALLADAQKWAAANQLRDYLHAIAADSLKKGRIPPELVDWLDWAERKADWLDPTVLVSDAVLDAPEPEKPRYSYW